MIHRLKIYTIVLAMNYGMDYLVSYSLYSFASPQTKPKSIKKHQSRATASTLREQMAITYNSFGALQLNKIFELLLLGQIRWYPGFNRCPLPSPRTRHVKSLRIFSNAQLFTRCISMLILKNLYCAIIFGFRRSSQIWAQTVHYKFSALHMKTFINLTMHLKIMQP